jgi:regulation of enolase protein 1 (concanavalin A-like superfamily)
VALVTTGWAETDWAQAHWLNPPVRTWTDGSELLVEAREGSDFWRVTSYGFVHDDGHALLRPFPDGSAVEVAFTLDFGQQFDQAGVLVRSDEEHWVKAGVEVSDGVPQLGAVVTRGRSDWSVAPVPAWSGRDVTVRASRAGDALTVRARADAGSWQLVRVAPLPPGDLLAGPFCCAPTRAGLVVRFRSAVLTAADASLHP